MENKVKCTEPHFFYGEKYVTKYKFTLLYLILVKSLY